MQGAKEPSATITPPPEAWETERDRRSKSHGDFYRRVHIDLGEAESKLIGSVADDSYAVGANFGRDSGRDISYRWISWVAWRRRGAGTYIQSINSVYLRRLLEPQKTLVTRLIGIE